ncbi:hypothetical protein FD755_019909 [Muntiacus reevesi]|uniref:ADAMTS/ADAMTS-like Spacer 1 domain-containing protein n=1 Tax=Muntiacus reevesi TaxID=9886 RepID=A0A5N3X5A1_MUNRE|nr:hypothetical protein FD755_019909 [Muntiacus reevesi]
MFLDFLKLSFSFNSTSYSLSECIGKEPTCQHRRCKRRGFDPWIGKIPWRSAWQPTPDCPPEAGDFRAQQCSAHNDVKYHGQFYEWLPVSNDPDNPCSLKCQAKGTALVVELAPKVLDGTRCYTESLDMCISGLCQVSTSFFAFYFSGGICVNSFCAVPLSKC